MPDMPKTPAIMPPAAWPPRATASEDDRRGVLGWDGPWLGASFTAVCLLGASSAALATPTFVPPAGVTQYRLAFVTDGLTTATSTAESTYNDFATSQADGNSSLPSTLWYAITSTSTESAASNISCGTSCNANVPIFLVDGTTEVATSTNALFAGSILNLIDEDENGSPNFGAYVWTGSNADGTGVSGQQLGTSTPVTGWDFFTSDMLSTGFAYPDASTQPIYAISGVITAPSVPEPATLSVLALGGVATGLVRRLRRKRPSKA